MPLIQCITTKLCDNNFTLALGDLGTDVCIVASTEKVPLPCMGTDVYVSADRSVIM